MAQTHSSALAEYLGEPVSQLTWREGSYLKGNMFKLCLWKTDAFTKRFILVSRWHISDPLTLDKAEKIPIPIWKYHLENAIIYINN